MFKYPQNFLGFNSLIVLKNFFFGMFLYLGEIIYFMFRAEKVRSWSLLPFSMKQMFE